jgi:putative hydrolase of HD superfamily
MERIRLLSDVDPETRERLAFLAVTHALCGVSRRNTVLDGSRSETGAEHSWHVALCAVVLGPAFAPSVDLGRVLQMLALHDLPEIVVGDTPAYDAGARAVAVARERQAARELLAQLPEGPELDALYAEFVEEATDEARFANAVDRLQPILLHSACDGAAWRKRAQGRTKLDEFVAKITDLWPPLGPLTAALVEEAQRRGDLIDDRVA